MNYTAVTTWALAAVLAIPLLSVPAKASDMNKETVVTFSAPVEIPGRVLPAGKYVLKLADVEENRDIVQIFNQDESRLLTTVLAVPDYRLVPRSHSIFTFEKRAAKSPEALKSWFYPGDNYGYDFVYPQVPSTAKQPGLVATTAAKARHS